MLINLSKILETKINRELERMPKVCLRGTKFNGQEKTEKIIIKVQPKERRVTLGIFLNHLAELL